MHRLIPFLAFLGLIGCAGDAPDPAAEVNRIASAFVAAYYEEFPEEVYEVGYPDAPTDRFGIHTDSAQQAWARRIDGWIRELDAIDTTALSRPGDLITYAYTREQLQMLADRRVCQMDLWNISPTWTGWQYMFASTFAIQPVSTAAEKEAALARLEDGARYIRQDVSNLRRGQDLGYLAPTSNVAAVIRQMDALIDAPASDSPMTTPAARASDAAFSNTYLDRYAETLLPAMIEYRDFLRDDYKGRAAIGVSANTDGEDCYAASVRYWSSVAMPAEEIHRKGLSEMARIQSEMLVIAKRSFDTDDVQALLAELRSNPDYTFDSEQEMLDHVNAAVARGKAAVGDWFGTLPDADLVVVPSPAYEKDSGGGFYSAGSADGSRPGTYQVGTYNPQGISKAGPESTAFHESYPGHHMQVSLALVNTDLHPILRYMGVSGFVEGWALYTERLADEMGLYSSDLARLGMLSNEAYRAARLVVDPGMHVLGWDREEAMTYMLDHTAEGPDSISSEVDRYAAVPGQATSYLIGSLEIQRLRRDAEQALGDDFDIRDFHDRVLANGGITLGMLTNTIESWIEENSN